MKTMAVAFLGMALCFSAIACGGADSSDNTTSALSSIKKDNYSCSSKALMGPRTDTYTESGGTTTEAHANALEKCRSLNGMEGGCVIVPGSCGSTRDTGQSDLTGPSVCKWEDPKTNQTGYTEGPTRQEARKAALTDCKNSGDGTPPGIECRVLTCSARGNNTDFPSSDSPD